MDETFRSMYQQYLKDESRTTGYAESISFPGTEDEVRADLKEYCGREIPVTVQGARTGLTGGCVPFGGHILNTSGLDRILGLTRAADGSFLIRLEPGISLARLRTLLAEKSLPTEGWSEESLAYYEEFKKAPEQFFPPDPTESSAFLGGIASCNASGSRSYLYGPMRPWVHGLRLALSDGDVLALQRGECFAKGRTLRVTTEGGRKIRAELPSYEMPKCKNASGYYVADDMDAIDLIIGSDGTLGVLTELTLRLISKPKVFWGVSVFFRDELQAIRFTETVRPELKNAAAIEYFDGNALRILRDQKENNAAFSSLPVISPEAECCVYVELHCESEEEAKDTLYQIGGVLEACGGSEADTWVARNQKDRDLLIFFRHSVPESTNMLIDLRRQTDPTITKLGSDMSVPDGKLEEIVKVYRSTIRDLGLDSATWGHIGSNHLHVNIIPRNHEDHVKGKALFGRWAEIVTGLGGAVSAEHGVGKIKRDFLRTMYGKEGLLEMARVKAAFDPTLMLARGNLFPEEILEEFSADAGKAAETPGGQTETGKEVRA